MAKARLFDLPETKGFFQVKGIVTGTDKDDFYVDKKTKTGKDFRAVKFGIEYLKKQTAYVSMNGMPQETVYFSKQTKKGEPKVPTEKVKWSERFSFNKEGYRIIGSNIGVTKKVDAEGKTVNDKKVLVDFDAAKEIGDNLHDGQSVFVKGKIEFGSYESNDTVKRTTKFIPNQVSLCGDIDFDDEKFEASHDFTQPIVFMGIEKEMNGEAETGRFVISAKIVTYSTIEDAEFIITDSKLASQLKKNLKPYNAIEVWGKLTTTESVEDVEDDDSWGESNDMKKPNLPTKRELVISGASKSSLDTETYIKSLVEEALIKITNAKNAKGDYADDAKGEWGSASADLSGNDEDEAW